jgi:gliding motility-associated-like protein
MKKFILLAVLTVTGLSAKAQFCSVYVTPSDTVVCPGDSVQVVAYASLLNGNQSFNFNGGALPGGWSAGGGTTFGQPCGVNPTGTPYYWASTSSATQPNITTAAFDVTCGGNLIFDMVYSVQSGAAPCEGPDQADEGVALQYSTDGGVTWITIEYYQPDGQILPAINNSTASIVNAFQQTPFTTWDTYVVSIPSGALTTSTTFRWVQLNSSTGNVYDNWGLDNITVNATGLPCDATAVVNWDNGLQDTTSFWINPMIDTTYTAIVFDTAGNYMCTSTPISINVFTNTTTWNLVDTAYSYCPTTNPQVAIQNLANGQAPYDIQWDIPATTTTVNLPTGGAEHDTITYHVSITDNCGFVNQDSVVLVVNQLLYIDSLQSIVSSACQPDGVVLAFVSGITGQPLYNWNGPGATNPSFINSTVWTNRPSGWYYFSVTDNYCTDSDSVFVDMLPPPSAAISQDVTSGCNTFDVTFTNGSQDAMNYYWDFGNGNTLSTSSTNNQTQTYSSNGTIMLIASTSPTCADTAYAAVTVISCGCTDPTALNFDPLAVQDDGSCILPDPIVLLPNVFTPNNDGENDVFQMQVTNVSEVRLVITNRWGNIVYEATGANPGWNGKTQSGQMAAEGVYYVQYEADNIYKTKTLSGHGLIHLVK